MIRSRATALGRIRWLTACIGVSPKHFARLRRVRRVLEHAGRTPLAQLATGSGYYDQSHMNADFRTIMGIPPASFQRGERPRPTPCAALRAA
ncbi:helix-turn-helix domain-containing protein [Nocardia arizonensis]|uniref:helix-turn-helix domain-containing protein n=1 Tax=Nocardia arizonensis TaxID=1141647 RepID=UPI0006D0ADA2|nr:helix-turn-helix domain-containing protein [Nocardia arizonensis]